MVLQPIYYSENMNAFRSENNLMKLFYHCFYERKGYFLCYKISAMCRGLSSKYLSENEAFVF